MTADIENLVLEHLRAIRATLADHGERLIRIEIHLSTLGQQLGALTTAVYSGQSDIDSLRRRIERIERRLELHDTATPNL
jgi:predicted  nucleic acid-binding Zn-ribbon protein